MKHFISKRSYFKKCINSIKCPFCKKIILKKVDTCPYCKRTLVEKIERKKPTKDYYQQNIEADLQFQLNKKPYHSNVNFKPLITILIIIFVGYLIFSEEDSLNSNLELKPTNIKFPELVEPKTITFKWNYNNNLYEVSEIFYKSVYKYYQTQPKTYTYYSDELPDDWVEDYYRMYLDINEEDNSFSSLLFDIKNEAEENYLTEDETAELVLAFVQSIPYDDDLANEILYGNNEIGPKYPYEVLYENSGVCGGKSFLAYILFKELGYGVALFEYEKDEHMAVGIKCSEEYSTYSSEYCYAETTTSGNPIGIIPEFNPDSNRSITKSELSHFGEETNNIEIKQLGETKIYQKKEGKIYKGVKENIEIYARIVVLEKEIDIMYKSLIFSENSIYSKQEELKKLESDLDYYNSANLISSYNNLVPKYNQLLKSVNSLIDEHNKNIAIYNNQINEINNLVKNLYPLE